MSLLHHALIGLIAATSLIERLAHHLLGGL